MKTSLRTDKYYMGPDELLVRSYNVLGEYLSSLKPLHVYGVPRGGTCALLYLIAQGLPVKPVLYWTQADVILDDIIDSGKTREKFSECNKPFLALVNKKKEDIKWVVFPWEKETGPEDAVVRILEGVGEDPNREGLLETPRRVVAAFKELTKGYQLDAKEILSRTFQEDYDEIVVLREIPYVSLCEHHLLPFSGHVSIGYLPAGKVVGLSKLARLVDCYAQRLQMQERMTKQIAQAIQDHLGARGVAVVVRGQHSCMACRGVKKTGAEMLTSVMLGVFRDKPEARAEVLGLLRSGG